MLNTRDLILETLLLEKLQKLDTERKDNIVPCSNIIRNGGKAYAHSRSGEDYPQEESQR